MDITEEVQNLKERLNNLEDRYPEPQELASIVESVDKIDAHSKHLKNLVVEMAELLQNKLGFPLVELQYYRIKTGR